MDYAIDYSFDEEKNNWTVNLTGEIDIFNSADLKKQLTDLTLEKNADLYINCKNLEFIDSTVLGALVGVLKNVKSYGGEIHLVKIKPNLSRLFKITNLDKAFIMDGDNDE